MNLTHRIRIARAAVFALGCQLAAGAATSGSSPTSDELIKLSEFNVAADRASGYRAQSAITATGFDAKIIDVPVTINVLTGEFAQDVGGSLQSEVLRYVPGVITNP